MFGAILGAATSIAGSIGGAIASRKANRRAQREIKKQQAQNEAWYNRRYNEDYLNTATAQRALSQARDTAQQNLSRALGRQAVMGGSDESVAQTQAANGEMMAQTESQLAAQGQARKDAIEQQYQQRAADLSNKIVSMNQAQAASAAQAGSGAMSAGMGLVSADADSYAQTGRGFFQNLFRPNKA